VTDILSGYQVREGLQTDPAGTHFVVQAKDIDAENEHRLNVEGLDRISSARDLSSYALRNGDILFLAKGRRRFATLVESLPLSSETVALYYFFILRPNQKKINPAFLAWVINQPEAQEYLDRAASGTTIPSLTKQAFLKLEISVPSLDKQIAIADLHQLSRREASLTRRLESQRTEYLHALCRLLWEEENA